MSLICRQETGLTAEECIACVGQSKLGPTQIDAAFYRDRTHRR